MKLLRIEETLERKQLFKNQWKKFKSHKITMNKMFSNNNNLQTPSSLMMMKKNKKKKLITIEGSNF
jgi:hypothetical protein